MFKEFVASTKILYMFKAINLSMIEFTWIDLEKR
jgi:hypothetical protein